MACSTFSLIRLVRPVQSPTRGITVLWSRRSTARLRTSSGRQVSGVENTFDGSLRTQTPLNRASRRLRSQLSWQSAASSSTSPRAKGVSFAPSNSKSLTQQPRCWVQTSCRKNADRLLMGRRRSVSLGVVATSDACRDLEESDLRRRSLQQ